MLSVTPILFWLLNIYGGYLMSALLLEAHRQSICQHFTLSFHHIYCSTAYQTLASVNVDIVYQENIAIAHTLMQGTDHILPF